MTFSVKGKANAAHGLDCPQWQLSCCHTAALGVLEASYEGSLMEWQQNLLQRREGFAGRSR